MMPAAPQRSIPASDAAAQRIVTLKIVNLSELSPQWNWISAAFRGAGQNWQHASSQNFNFPDWVPRRMTLARLLAGSQAAQMLGHGPAVLVTHGPRPALYGALLAGRRLPDLRHLAFSFNYTDLPTGLTRRLMTRALQSVERFVVFSQMEREIYSSYFDLPANRFDMLHWGVRAPEVDLNAAAAVDGDYICALGSQGRDYKTLLLAMRRLPRLHLVIVAAAGNLAKLANLPIPANVTVKTDIPLAQAMNILAHCRFMVLPLIGSKVPCGHVTIVSAMHLGKAVIATESSGLDDYITPQTTGLTCPAHDAAGLAIAMQTLHDDPALAQRLGLAGQKFARKHCTEENTVEYMQRFLRISHLSH